MRDQTPLQSRSGKLKKALVWMAEQLEANPGISRTKVLQEAELRFDLTPLECDFLNSHCSQE